MTELDYDLRAALEYNPQGAFAADDIAEVLAVWEGEKDGDDWRWIVRLHDGRFVFIVGGCDYTGWDCQSWAAHDFADTADAAAYCCIKGEQTNYRQNDQEVYHALIEQLAGEKAETWREKTDRDMGVKS